MPSAASSQAGLTGFQLPTTNFSCHCSTKYRFQQFLHSCLRKLFSDGSGIAECLHSRCLAMAVSLVSLFRQASRHNINVDLKEAEWTGVDCIHLAQKTVHRRNLEHTAMQLHIP
jgi:hypothetical protein